MWMSADLEHMMDIYSGCYYVGRQAMLADEHISLECK
jgi:hypothetical protein